MGAMIPRACLVPGCSALAVRRSRCTHHATLLDRDEWASDSARFRDPTDELRPLYFTARWRELRQLVLDREPLCRTCSAAGLTTPATDVDHIVRARTLGETARFWDATNLQPLCKSCHSRKTAHEVGFVKAGAR